MKIHNIYSQLVSSPTDQDGINYRGRIATQYTATHTTIYNLMDTHIKIETHARSVCVAAFPVKSPGLKIKILLLLL